ncbi:unnamed protein product [Owenia fusiformis]|uniref:Uncharacterized protein n=1 Tax=Owenia fusiformis TaxID=6347 RepID=A0A8J1UAT9_OWEFU|nr:unnamed protein product [Owenia fusiformis]
MSLNNSHANGGVLIYSGERILIFHDGLEVSFDSTSPLPHFKGTKKGRAYLTTHRVIFNNKNPKDTLQSFSMPFFKLTDLKLEQPVFNANYIKGTVTSEQGGNWEGQAKFKMWFTNGGAIEFGQAMLRAGQLARRRMTPQPPVYSQPTGNYYQAPPPAYTPPQTPLYGFVPTQTFPTAPPSDGVFMYDAPPPYPGIDSAASAPPPQTAAESKAQEAASSAYYNPTNPHNVYVPQDAPPPYSAVSKKND